jgi:pimeloyl-ACP methyl ester carboxylesterase
VRARPILYTAIILAGHFTQQTCAQQLNASAPSSEPVRGYASADVGGGRTLRYMCAGSGMPTIIVEPGGSVSTETVLSWEKPVGWAVIFPELSRATRTCLYDRAGLGRSDPVPKRPRTSLDVARDLKALLAAADIAPPYVLAGQSVGGMNARMFASLYPETVAGLVLIDSSHPDSNVEYAKVLPPPSPGESEFLQGWRQPRDLTKGPEGWDLKGNADLLRTVGGIGNKPLVVLTQSPTWNDPFAPDDVEPLIDAVTQRLAAQLVMLSTSGKQVIATKAGHNIQADEPQLVIDAILDVVSQVRARQK